ncbi:uncharacterized protein PODANS_4_4460 [Podospora anserina S mat+]|uniref:Podospora anserina S mat+ genomic DNA chromosome 4, supercontig 4 n=1 Tax=Podospora anserina (strain S / ATCC MYA-4624 / DSM 980 / FGSC 10383) TaxID=515849 RepID=B2AQE0_PODAN|nr:uncharacterized protein PODANS_4_4460 [Podospora anserina S mat+]CAP67080.1 unnamed protein product [Podospora anserina S mat+]CDP28822.1 Putative protein of unknown function [Podospora anserina S mat+]
MPAGEIVTIINNSGKVISTGKQLVNIFKDAQAAYRERKEAVKAEKAQRAGIRRAQTFDVNLTRGGPYSEDFNYTHGPGKGGFIIEEIDDEKEKEYERRMIGAPPGRRRSHEDDDDGRSHASSRFTTRSKRTSCRQQALPAPAGPVSAAAPRTVVSLTESALKAHSEISAAAPSKAPSKAPSAAPGPGALVHRSRTEPVVNTVKKKKSIDMDLAYGSIPPDLAQRHDLAPKNVPISRSIGPTAITMTDRETEVDPQVDIDPQEAEALGLMDKIEEFLQEADCVHASATNMIESLQQKPEAAAAVALSLAELSALVGKMSPAFLAFLKGGSPAVFALLASPQFLIGAGVAAGITVVMFGGWKIVKKMTGNAPPLKEQPIAMRALPMASGAQQHQQRLQELEGQAEQQSEASYQEPLVVDDVQELSSIEMWRRGIEPAFVEGTTVAGDDAAEIEMMSREAEKYARENFRSNKYDIEVEPSDSVSQIGWSPSKSMRTYKTYKSRSSRHHSTSKRNREDRMTEVSVDDVPERRSSRKDDGESVAGSERSHRGSRKTRDSKDRDGAESAVSDRSHRSSTSRRDHREKERDRDHSRLEGINEKDEGSSVAGNERSHRSKREREREREHKSEKKNDKDDDGSVASFRSARSTRSHREKERDRDDNSSSVSRSSKHISSKVTPVKEEGADEKDDRIKKPNMLKQLFKKLKDKEDRDSVVSVMA